MNPIASPIKHYRQLLGIAKSWAITYLPHWDDDTHRDLLAKHGAVALPPEQRISATSMSLPQLHAALDDYAARGWVDKRGQNKNAHSTSSTKRVPANIGLIVKLWGQAGAAGAIKEATRANLLKWVAHYYTKRAIKSLDDLSSSELQSVIEGLKAILARRAA